MKILIINGPNINFIGKGRSQKHYGNQTLEEVVIQCTELAKQYNTILHHVQSNHEGEIITHIQNAKDNNYTHIIINAGAYTHTSIAIADALAIHDIHITEVHMSNIYAREKFRHKSYISCHANHIMIGMGPAVYKTAVYSIVSRANTA